MLLFVRHAAQRLDIHPDTLRRWAREGRIALVRLPSGRLRVDERELDRILCPDSRVERIMESLWT